MEYEISHARGMLGLEVLVGAFLGLVAHHRFFIRGEWHVQAPAILWFHLSLFGTLILGNIVYAASGVGYIFKPALITSTCYLYSLFASIVLYRTLFHRLTKAGFKGPWYMRISKLWHVWQCRTSENHLLLENLNKEYGDFIRTGPSEITVFHPDAFSATDGPRTSCIKSDWYDLLWPESALLTTRDRIVHDARRREWKIGFSPQALAHHFAKTLTHVEMLTKAIEADINDDRDSEMRNLCFWLGFDVMGDFVFGKSFDMLSNKEWHHMVVHLQRALSLLGFVNPAPWLIQIAFRAAPRIYQIGDWFRMAEWTHDQISTRLKAGFNEKQNHPDLVHYLLEQGEPQTTERILRMRGDSLNAIVAGSEPIPVVLLGLFSELARKPHHAEIIYQELTDQDITDTKVLSQLPHLNAVIQEALRLYPVLPTGGTRNSGDEGVQIADVFIPPHTTVVMPRFSIHRREDCFENALEFIPERWTTRREMVLNPAAFNPWGTGRHSCIARVMANDMLRVATAQLVKRFRFRLTPGETGRRVLENMKDQLAPNPGHLALRFELR